MKKKVYLQDSFSCDIFSSTQIRSDTSEILEETIPLIKDKVMEMNYVYARIDKLEVC